MGNNRGDKGSRGPQNQGGLSHESHEGAGAAREDRHPERAGLTDGAIGQQSHAPQPDGSLEAGDDDRAPSGASGDDGGYDPGATADSPEPPRNVTREGGEGGLGGTGDARPHRGVDDRSGRHASLDDPEDEQREPPDAQGGGTRQDREQRVEERKNAESGAGASRKQPDGRAAPAPGAPVDPASKP